MKPLRFAVIGAGSFAAFAVAEFARISGSRFAGVHDEKRENAEKLKSIADDIEIYSTLEDIWADQSIDLVYIATPPGCHYAQSRAALLSGKHVICEKPAAIRVDEAEELKTIASERNLVFVVNLMQRYNPLFEAVREIIRDKVFGEFLHGFFENYASDEYLREEHWFWDEAVSGGIFIEHGVHFFDMFSGWFGEGKVISSQKISRRGMPNLWDRVHATVLYSDALVNFYHGFDQAKIMDRQEIRLEFERGDITLFEWVPTRLTIRALCNESELQHLQHLFPEARVATEKNGGEYIPARARFRDFKYQYKIELTTPETLPKESVYRHLVRSMFRDQIRWIQNRSVARRISDENAVSSLRMAASAEAMAARIQGN